MNKQQGIFWAAFIIVATIAVASIAETKTKTIPDTWLISTNTTYGYSVKHQNDYIPFGTPELYGFRKGLLQDDPTHTIYIFSLTEENHREVQKHEFGSGSGWYGWATAGFPDDGSDVARISMNKRQETYGANTYTVVNYDPGSSWSGAPMYYLIDDKTVFLITEHRVGEFDDSIIKEMLASFRTNF